MKNKYMTQSEAVSCIEEMLQRYYEQRRPIRHSTLLKVPNGAAYRCYLTISPLSRALLSYRIEPEPLH